MQHYEKDSFIIGFAELYTGFQQHYFGNRGDSRITGIVSPFCLQVDQHIPIKSESSYNSVVSEYTLDPDGYIQVRLIRTD